MKRTKKISEDRRSRDGTHGYDRQIGTVRLASLVLYHKGKENAREKR